jgi:hypothetical protein
MRKGRTKACSLPDYLYLWPQFAIHHYWNRGVGAALKVLFTRCDFKGDGMARQVRGCLLKLWRTPKTRLRQDTQSTSKAAAQDIGIYVAPAWDTSDTWLASMRHIVGILYAEIDKEAARRARRPFDVSGHYARIGGLAYQLMVPDPIRGFHLSRIAYCLKILIHSPTTGSPVG